MKLKITSKWNGEVLELEGTEEELAVFMNKYKPQYHDYYLWFTPYSIPYTTGGICIHDYSSYNPFSSVPAVCSKCGQYQPTITYTDLPYNVSGFITTSSVTD